MQMHIARRLSEAVGSWLHMEFCCYRAGLLSESSLKAAVGHVLSSFPILVKGERVHADFAHELLNPNGQLGRKKELDFALVLAGDGLRKRKAQIAVETKWAGSSHCTPSKIFRDFLRLSEIKRGDPETVCIFLLAGSHRDMCKVLRAMPFVAGGKVNTGIGSSGKEKRLRPNRDNKDHVKCFSAPFKSLSFAGFTIPESFVCQSHGLHPLQTAGGTVDFQAIAWEIKSVSSENLNITAW
ncbi:hypothetical protein [Pseudomonas sp. NBRC 111142]|uniref:hypothetical protein n=1 Tax=Pseudomonas sp. NBRC 111142 TaxID=1661057 RepID=UPI000A58C03E|nr:hypothetical protein [Pseudomonas sp. NBRC 111142]